MAMATGGKASRHRNASRSAWLRPEPAGWTSVAGAIHGCAR